jgi:hypothetical protein
VKVEDALVANLADDNDVLEVTSSSSGKRGAEFDEHAAPVLLSGDNQHRVRGEHSVKRTPVTISQAARPAAGWHQQRGSAAASVRPAIRGFD